MLVNMHLSQFGIVYRGGAPLRVTLVIHSVCYCSMGGMKMQVENVDFPSVFAVSPDFAGISSTVTFNFFACPITG